jgi:hypothetical protein
MIALSPEWDRWFDEAFTDLVTSDRDLLRAEFAAMVDAAGRQSAPPAKADAGPLTTTLDMGPLTTTPDVKGGRLPPEYFT